MSLAITFLGHAGFLLDDGSHRLAIDPFLTGNPLAVHRPEQIDVQHIALTHGHGDHLGDTVAIAQANHATVHCVFEIHEYLAEQNITTNPANPGGKLETDFGWIAFTPAIHSSSYDGRYLGIAAGLMIHMAGLTFYHCGDTALFGDMKLLGEIYKPHIAAIPVGDRFTMGPQLGARAAELIRPRFAIPIHYKTFEGLLTDDISAFRPAGITVKELAPGETWTVDLA